MKISIRKTFWLLLPIFLIVPGYFLTIPSLKSLFIVSKALLTIFFIFYIVLIKKHMSLYNILLTLLMTIILVSTIINSGNINRIISVFCSVLSLSYYIEIMSNKAPRTTINTFCFVLGVYVFINFILMLVYPEGMYIPMSWEDLEGDFYSQANWLLGFKNHHVRFFFPLLYFLILKKINHCYKSKIKMDSILLMYIIIVGISAFLGKSGTVIGGYVIFIIVYVVSYMVKKNILKTRTVIWGIISLFLFLLFFGNSDFVLSIVELLFGKSYTFGERLIVWSKAILSISSSISLLLFGHGKLQNSDSIYILGFNNTHNSLLEIIFQGGLLSFMIFLLMLWLISKKNKKIHNLNYSMLNSTMLLTLLLMMQVETMYFDNTINCLFSCMYFSNYYLDSQLNKEGLK